MDYCKWAKIPPAQKWAWDKASKEYDKTQSKDQRNN